jgi:uncharacterized protein
MIPLTVAERRVLGCLAEKQLATPQHYPLTESPLISACNQREPGLVEPDRAVGE